MLLSRLSQIIIAWEAIAWTFNKIIQHKSILLHCLYKETIIYYQSIIMTPTFYRLSIAIKVTLLIGFTLALSGTAKAANKDSIALLINDTICQQLKLVDDTSSMRQLFSKIRRCRRKLNHHYKPLLQEYITLSEKLNYQYGQMKAYDYMGLQERYDENYEKAIGYHKQSLAIAMQLKDSAQMCYNYNNLGQAYRKQDLNILALPYFHKALHIQEKVGLDKSASYTHNSIGATYLVQNELEKALYHLDQSTKIARSNQDKRTLAFNYGLIGEILLLQNQADSALAYFNDALVIKKELNYTKGLAVTYHLLGQAWFVKGDDTKALEHFNLAIPIHQKYNNQRYLSLCYAYIAKIKLKLNQTDSTAFYLKKAHRLASKVHSIENLLLIGRTYTELYQTEENWQQAMLSIASTNALQDSLNNAKYHKQMQTLEIDYQTKKKVQQIEILSAENKIKNQRLRLGVAIIIILILGLVFTYYILQTRKKSAKLKEEKLRQQLLKSQMNPHFIFNALGSIQNYMYKNDPKKAARYMGNFAALTRSILNNSSSDQVPLDEEIDTLKNYLELEQLRANSSFTYEIEGDDDLDTEFIQVPPMLLQPFIENSIKHGLRHLDEGGLITLRFIEKDNFICAEIEDNGIGITASGKEDGHKSMATQIFKQRISLLKNSYPTMPDPLIQDLTTTNKKGTLVRIFLPILN